jgi:hypothetical protein
MFSTNAKQLLEREVPRYVQHLASRCVKHPRQVIQAIGSVILCVTLFVFVVSSNHASRGSLFHMGGDLTRVRTRIK